MSGSGYVSFWRIGKDTAKYAATDMSGSGGLYVSGRWHEKGNPILYAGSSISLCCLETLVHYDATGLPFRRKLIEYQIPISSINQGQRVDVAQIPNWDGMPDSTKAAEAGTRWLTSNASLLMFVPSVIIPMESNVLINPKHPDINLILAVDHGYFKYDPRLLIT